MDKAGFVSGIAEKESKADIENKKVDVSEKQAATRAETKQKGTPPYREKGMQSNNKEPGEGK